MKKYLVLGSNSFAGSSFVDWLLANGNEVIGISRSPEPNNLILGYAYNPRKDKFFKFFQMDLNNNFEAIVQIIRIEKPSVIIDFAGQGMVAQSWIWPEQWYLTNVLSKVKLHNFLKDCDFLDRYIRISTPEVYGDSKDLIDETAPYNPSTPYAVSHAAIDMSLKAYYKQYGFPVIFTRFANFYGPGQQLYRIVPKASICALTGSLLPLHGGGSSIRSFIHHKDVSEGIMRSIENGKVGETYHFSTSEFVSIATLVEKVAEVVGTNINNFVKVSEDRPGKDHAYLMTSDKAIKTLNWVPKYTLTEGINETVVWVKENLSKIKGLSQEYTHKK